MKTADSEISEQIHIKNTKQRRISRNKNNIKDNELNKQKKYFYFPLKHLQCKGRKSLKQTINHVAKYFAKKYRRNLNINELQKNSNVMSSAHNNIDIIEVPTTSNFSCQFHLESNHSLEIVSFGLSNSTCDISSMSSALCFQQRIKDQQGSVFYHFLQNVLRSIKTRPCQNVARNKHYTALKLPNEFTASIRPKAYLVDKHSNAEKRNKKVVIREVTNAKTLIGRKEHDNATNVKITVTRPPNKICGPGEVFFETNNRL